MTLRNKIALIKIIGLAGTLIVLFIISRTIMLAGFERAEQDAAAQGLARVTAYLSQQFNDLDEKATDWSNCDACYQLMRDRNARFVKENVTIPGFQAIKVNMFAVLDNNGHIIICKLLDTKGERWQKCPSDLPQVLTGIALNKNADGKAQGLSGIIMLSTGPMMIASAPILTCASTGPARGMLVFGMYLDAKQVTELGDMAQVSARISKLSKNDPLFRIQQNPGSLRAGKLELMPVSPNKIVARTTLTDIWGKPSLVLETATPRSIYTQGLSSVHDLLLALLIVGLIAGAIELLLTEKIVSQRLSRLSRDVAKIGANGDHTSRLQVESNDELSALARAFNNTLDALEQSQEYMRENEERLMTILNSVQIGVMIVDPETHTIVDVNETALKMIGATAEDLVDRVCHQCVCPAETGSCPITDLHQKVDSSEQFLLRMDGSKTPILKTAVHTILNGQPRLIESFVDISERKKTEEALRIAHNELEASVDARTQELANANKALIGEIIERKQIEKSVLTRLRYEECLASCSQALLGVGEIIDALKTTTDQLLITACASRVYVFENIEDAEDGLYAHLVTESCAEGVEPHLGHPLLQRVPYAGDFSRWHTELCAGRPIMGPVSSMQECEQKLLCLLGIKSVLILPIKVAGKLYGFIGFDDCEHARIWNDSDVRVLLTAAGMISAYVERRHAEEEVIQTNLENERLLSSISSALIVCDTSGIVRKWNQAAEDILGIAASSVINRPLLESGLNWEHESTPSAIIDAIGNGEPTNMGHISVIRPDGKSVTLMLTTAPILDSASNVWECLVVGSDVTEIRSLEVQLQHAQKLESIGQLAAGIAHEMNTPIQYVGDNTRFLQDSVAQVIEVLKVQTQALQKAREGSLDQETLDEVERVCVAADIEYIADEIPKAAEQSLEGVNRVAKIVRAMKQFSHPGNAEKSEEDINAAIESTITVSRNEWKYVAELVTDLDSGLPLVPCMLGDLNQVVLNLIVNAAHAIGERRERIGTTEKGRITVSTIQVDDWIEIRISDTGSGIPEAIQQRIFEPFFTTKSVGKGTGQGLALARSIVTNMHSGTITFDTREDEGTTFIIRIPLILRQAA